MSLLSGVGPVQVVEIAAAGVTAGVLSALFGIGGGVILAPLLGLILQCGQHQAQGLTLALLLLPLGLPAVIEYRRAGISYDRILAAVLIAAFLPGAAAGAWLAHRISSSSLRLIFAGVLVWMARSTVNGRSVIGQIGEPGALPTSRRTTIAIGLAIGFAAGVSSGALGIGGGIVIVPLAMRLLGMGFPEARLTSLVMMLPPIGLPAVVVYSREQGGLPWPLIGLIAATFAAGTWTGARFTSREMGPKATYAMAGFMLLLAGSLIYKAVV